MRFTRYLEIVPSMQRSVDNNIYYDAKDGKALANTRFFSKSTSNFKRSLTEAPEGVPNHAISQLFFHFLAFTQSMKIWDFYAKTQKFGEKHPFDEITHVFE